MTKWKLLLLLVVVVVFKSYTEYIIAEKTDK